MYDLSVWKQIIYIYFYRSAFLNLVSTHKKSHISAKHKKNMQNFSICLELTAAIIQNSISLKNVHYDVILSFFSCGQMDFLYLLTCESCNTPGISLKL